METRRRTAVRIRPRARQRGGSSTRCAVFTSVDGVLLDAATFEPGESRVAVERLQEADIPVIPVTVMTLGEVAPIAAELNLRHSMIIEAGGGIARWKDGSWEVEGCGPAAETFLDVVRDIEDRSGSSLLIYSALPPDQASLLSGRQGPMLEASTHRCFSEPFAIESGDFEAISRAAAAIGFTVRRGPRFYHLCRSCDEGEAFSRLREEIGCDVAVGVGGSLIDAEFLSRCDVAIIVPRAQHVIDGALLERVPGAHIAPAAGPAGWAAAVREALQVLRVSA